MIPTWPTDFIDRPLCGDSLELLKMIPDQSVQCCITSPPYWNLRDYSACECSMSPSSEDISSTLRGGGNRSPKRLREAKADCPECNGTGKMKDINEKQIGLESTPEQYTAKLVEIFREVRRLLKDDGTLWLNLGDCYAGSGKAQGQKPHHTNMGKPRSARPYDVHTSTPIPLGLKRKDLVGIPWRVAFALQADGWYLRSEIIWAKTNVMPESVLDRPSTSHEKIFILAKSEDYYYDVDSIRQPYKDSSLARKEHPNTDTGARLQKHQPGSPSRSEEIRCQPPNPLGTNLKTVWELPTAHYGSKPEHFATFPEKIPERCILAGSRVGDIILDPFLGAGTTAKRSQELGRHWIGIDLKPQYCNLASDNTAQREIFNGPK